MSEITRGIATVRDSAFVGYVAIVLDSGRDGDPRTNVIRLADAGDLHIALGYYLQLRDARTQNCCEHNSDAHDASGCLDCKCNMAPWSPGFNPTEARV